MNKEKFEKILASGLDFNQWAILQMLYSGEDISTLGSKVAGWKLLLNKKGFIDILGTITAQGVEFLKDLDMPGEEVKVKVPKLSFGMYTKELFEKIKAKITEMTGNKDGQFKNPSKEYLRPSSEKELETQLSRFIAKYNYRDLGRIEEEILKHVEYAINANKHRITDKYVRSIYYFIMKKDYPSQLLTKLTNTEETVEIKEAPQTQRFI